MVHIVGIVVDVKYDSFHNQLVGLLLPTDESTGCPIPFSYKVKNVEDIENLLSKEKSSLVYTVLAKSLDTTIPPFCLQIFGTDNKFSASTVRSRWRHTIDELEKVGIEVVGISADGDPRLLAAMCKEISSKQIHKILTIQDILHILTKLRNRLIKPYSYLPMGIHYVSIAHFLILVRSIPKTIHGLNRSDIFPEDHQNVTSMQKMMQENVLEALRKYVPNSDATIKYLELAQQVADSFTSLKLTPSDRIYKIWNAIFFYRIWYFWLKKQKKYKLSQHYITTNTFKCIEINGKGLVELVRKFRAESKEEQKI